MQEHGSGTNGGLPEERRCHFPINRDTTDSEPSDHDREIADQSAECKFIAPDDFLEGTPLANTTTNLHLAD